MLAPVTGGEWPVMRGVTVVVDRLPCTAGCLPACRPRELPLEEGQPLVGLEVKRLGLKARW